MKKILFKPTIQALRYLTKQASYTAQKNKRVEENFNQLGVNNTFSDAMVVAITSNAAIKTNSNAAFIHCRNHTAFCRVEGGKQSRAEETETRRGQLSAFRCSSCVTEDASLYTLHTCSHILVSRFIEYPSIHQSIIAIMLLLPHSGMLDLVPAVNGWRRG